MASNAKVNEEKSQAFYFVRGANDGEDLQPEDIPYPVLGDPLAEVTHLGYPFRLDGGIPQHTIDKRLNSIQAKVNVLATTKTTLLARVRILRLSILPDWDNVSVKEMLSLPFHSDIFGYVWPDIHETNTQHWERHGLRVWGDVLWYNSNEKGKLMHEYCSADSYPLVLPSPSGVKSNYVPSRGHPDTYELFSGAAGRLVKKHWVDMWKVMHPT
ncbi:hypothetical protein, partial [Sporisorium scitamineum]